MQETRDLDGLALIFKLNNGMVDRVLDRLPDDDFWRSAGEGGNPIGWLLGHLTETRLGLLRELGDNAPSGWGTRFARGSERLDRSAYPSRDALEAAWKGTRKRMRDAFAGLTPAQLATASAGPPLPGAETVAQRLAFFAFHESYHVGQMAFVRRRLGHSPVAG
jgi:uncharacterized damage-inducible protein DinB